MSISISSHTLHPFILIMDDLQVELKTSQKVAAFAGGIGSFSLITGSSVVLVHLVFIPLFGLGALSTSLFCCSGFAGVIVGAMVFYLMTYHSKSHSLIRADEEESIAHSLASSATPSYSSLETSNSDSAISDTINCLLSESELSKNYFKYIESKIIEKARDIEFQIDSSQYFKLIIPIVVIEILDEATIETDCSNIELFCLRQDQNPIIKFSDSFENSSITLSDATLVYSDNPLSSFDAPTHPIELKKMILSEGLSKEKLLSLIFKLDSKLNNECLKIKTEIINISNQIIRKYLEGKKIDLKHKRIIACTPSPIENINSILEHASNVYEAFALSALHVFQHIIDRFELTALQFEDNVQYKPEFSVLILMEFLKHLKFQNDYLWVNSRLNFKFKSVSVLDTENSEHLFFINPLTLEIGELDRPLILKILDEQSSIEQLQKLHLQKHFSKIDLEIPDCLLELQNNIFLLTDYYTQYRNYITVARIAVTETTGVLSFKRNFEINLSENPNESLEINYEILNKFGIKKNILHPTRSLVKPIFNDEGASNSFTVFSNQMYFLKELKKEFEIVDTHNINDQKSCFFEALSHLVFKEKYQQSGIILLRQMASYYIKKHAKDFISEIKIIKSRRDFEDYENCQIEISGDKFDLVDQDKSIQIKLDFVNKYRSLLAKGEVNSNPLVFMAMSKIFACPIHIYAYNSTPHTPTEASIINGKVCPSIKINDDFPNFPVKLTLSFYYDSGLHFMALVQD